MPDYQGMVSLDYTGTRFVLGRTAESYALWDVSAGGEPQQVFPATPEGWTAAWLRFRELEGGAPAAPTSVPDALVRPLGIGNVLGGSFQVWGRNFLAFLAVMASVMLPFAILQVVVFQAVLGPELEALFSGLIPRNEIDVYRRIIEDNIPVFIAAAVGLGLISLFVNAFVTAALIRGGLQGFTGGRVRAGATMSASVRKTHSVAWILFLTGLLVALVGVPVMFLAVMLGTASGSPAVTALLIIPAVLGLFLFASRYLFGPSALIAEGLRGVAALRRSWELTRGRVWPIFGTFLLVLLMAGVAAALLTVPFQLVAQSGTSLGTVWLISALGGAFASTLTTPFSTLAIVHLYIDARARKEALDPAVLDPEPGPLAP